MNETNKRKEYNTIKQVIIIIIIIIIIIMYKF